ncbi:MAG: restriction endonuclease subunit S [Bacteroidaceae bacterium]|nr:restriction endonuclease subunit S [Bacteroidaceae bacterium]
MDRSKWEYKKLGDICMLLNGFAFKSEKYVDNGIRVMRITNVQKGEIVDDDPKFYPMSSQSEIQRYMLKENDLLVSLTGNVGRVGLLQRELLPAALNQRVACLRLKGISTDLRYLFHLMNSDLFENECIVNSQGIAQKNMSTKWLSDYKLPVPPLSDQQRIVAELDCLNEMIAVKQEQLKEFDKLAQSIFYDMFGDPVSNPNKWESQTLEKLIQDNIILYHLDGNHGGDYPRREEFVEQGVSYIGANNIKDGYIDFSSVKYLTEKKANTLRKGIAKNEDVLFAHNATVGPVALLRTTEERVVLSTSLTAYRCNKQRLLPLFLKSYMESTWFVSQYIHTMKQATRNQVPITQQRKMTFILPPLSLQQQFAEKISAIESQKELVKQSIAETQALLDYTMDKYFG